MTLLRAAATVSGFTMLSRVLGFVRDILIASLLGAGPVADAFFVAFKLPNFFRRLFAEGAFNAGFVPLFSQTLERDGLQAARRFAEQALAVLLAALLLFVTAMQAAMPWLMLVLAPGFADDPEKFDLAVTLTRLTFPYLLFVSLVSLLGGVLNSLNRFAAVAFTPVLLNLCLIAGITLLAGALPTAGHALAWAVAAAGALQFVWLIVACRRAGITLRLPAPRLTARVRRLLVLMLPVALGASAVQINLLIDIVLASLLPEGSISFLFYADRLSQLPIGVIGVAVGTALLPMLSRLVAAGQADEARARLNRALELALFLALPAALALVAVPGELVAALFQRGEFDAHAVRATALAVAAYALGLPAYVLVKLLGPAFFARQDTRTPVVVGLAAMVVNIALNLILMRIFLHAGLALATALAAWLNAGLLGVLLYRRGWMRLDDALVARMARTVPALAVLAVVLWGLSRALAPAFAGSDEASRIAALALLVGGGLVAYFLSAMATGALGRQDLRALLRRG